VGAVELDADDARSAILLEAAWGAVGAGCALKRAKEEFTTKARRHEGKAKT